MVTTPTLGPVESFRNLTAASTARLDLKVPLYILIDVRLEDCVRRGSTLKVRGSCNDGKRKRQEDSATSHILFRAALRVRTTFAFMVSSPHCQ